MASPLSSSDTKSIDELIQMVDRNCKDGWRRTNAALLTYEVDLYGPKENELPLIRARAKAIEIYMAQFDVALWLGYEIKAVNKRDDPQWDGLQKAVVQIAGPVCEPNPGLVMPYYH